MTNDTLQQLWKSYLEAHADIPAVERERLLGQSVADDIVFSNPTGDEGRGFGSLAELGTGHTYARLNEQGRLTDLAGFF